MKKIYGWFRYDLPRGIKNYWRWRRIIWEDCQWDWETLARIMEFKLRLMAKATDDWHVMSASRSKRQMLIAAHILKRLREDNYDPYVVQFPGDPEPCLIKGFGDWMKPDRQMTRLSCKRADMQAKNELELLGKILVKHMRSWWD